MSHSSHLRLNVGVSAYSLLVQSSLILKEHLSFLTSYTKLATFIYLDPENLFVC